MLESIDVKVRASGWNDVMTTKGAPEDSVELVLPANVRSDECDVSTLGVDVTPAGAGTVVEPSLDVWKDDVLGLGIRSVRLASPVADCEE